MLSLESFLVGWFNTLVLIVLEGFNNGASLWTKHFDLFCPFSVFPCIRLLVISFRWM